MCAFLGGELMLLGQLHLWLYVLHFFPQGDTHFLAYLVEPLDLESQRLILSCCLRV